jgi:CheY-like chemotaxis protein
MDTCEILKRSLDKRITVETELKAESAIVNGDWSQLQSSLLNIGINSGHAMPDGGTLTFSTANITLDGSVDSEDSIELPPGSYLHLDVRDNGCGIAKEHLRHIFEPFFTTRKQSEGTGLGLAAVYGAIQQHRGVITVFSELDKGTCFSIYLPLVEGKEQQVPERKTIERGEGCLLIIDDEPVVRATARMMLERLGYTILEAENGRIGLDVYRRHRQGIDVVILDMIMPVMDGTECFYQLKKMNGDVKVIISSGFTRDADLSGLKEDGLFDFVRKPYSMEQLSQVVAQAIRSNSP